MDITRVGQFIGRQKWLDPVANILQKTVDVALNQPGPLSTKVRDFLHGTWLGHPLHPAVTDIPVGAWTTGTIIDVMEAYTGDPELRRGADAAIGIGLAGAAAAAVSGLNDWQHTEGDVRRLGVLHGLLNVSATSLYLTSWLLRTRHGSRTAARSLSLLGFATAWTSAYLGGHLVYQCRIGVNHAPQSELPTDFVPVLAESELPEGKLHRADADGVPVVLLRRGRQIFALADTCAHLGGPLSEGKLEGDCVQCPWHGSKFSFEDGHPVQGPTAFSQPCFEARVRDGQIEIRTKLPGITRQPQAAPREMQPVS